MAVLRLGEDHWRDEQPQGRWVGARFGICGAL